MFKKIRSVFSTEDENKHDSGCRLQFLSFLCLLVTFSFFLIKKPTFVTNAFGEKWSIRKHYNDLQKN